jgi:hypothetical protein
VYVCEIPFNVCSILDIFNCIFMWYIVMVSFHNIDFCNNTINCSIFIQETKKWMISASYSRHESSVWSHCCVQKIPTQIPKLVVVTGNSCDFLLRLSQKELLQFLLSKILFSGNAPVTNAYVSCSGLLCCGHWFTRVATPGSAVWKLFTRENGMYN